MTGDDCETGTTGGTNTAQAAAGTKSVATCDVCHDVLSTTAALNRHKRLQHGIHTPTYGRCDKCNKVLRYGRVLNRHVRNCCHVKTESAPVGGGSTIACGRCHKAFTTKKSLQKHESVVHGAGHLKTYQCSRCSTRFSATSLRSRHEALVHGIGDVRTYTCDTCSKQFKEEHKLRSHNAVVHGIGNVPKHTCHICHKVTRHRGNLTKHLARVHSLTYVPLPVAASDRAAATETRGVTTETCDNSKKKKPTDKACTTAASTDNCITTDEHGAVVKKHKCPRCEKAYLYRGTLERHMRRPCNSFTCPVCGKVFPLKGYLQRHMLYVHVDGWPHACDQCDKAYKNKSDLRDHKGRVHGLERTHKCDLCPETFTAKATLTRHMRNKHGVPKRVLPLCEQCGASFTYRRSLEKHIRTSHTERAMQLFTCDICSHSFTEKGNMRRHIRAKHPVIGDEGTCECAVCKKQFGNRVHLCRHKCPGEARSPTFPCDTCTETFPTESGMKKHKGMVHKLRVAHGDHECCVCHDAYDTKSNLRRHMESKHPRTSTCTLADTAQHAANTASADVAPVPMAHVEVDEKKPVVTCTWSLKPSPPRHPGEADEMIEILSDDDDITTKPDWKPRIQSFGSVSAAVAWPDVHVKQEHSS